MGISVCVLVCAVCVCAMSGNEVIWQHTHANTRTHTHDDIRRKQNYVIGQCIYECGPRSLSLSLSLSSYVSLSISLSLSISPSLAGPLTGCLWVLKLHEIRNLLLWHNVCKEQRRGDGERDREGPREVARQLRGQALMTSRCGLRACGAKIACFPI